MDPAHFLQLFPDLACDVGSSGETRAFFLLVQILCFVIRGVDNRFQKKKKKGSDESRNMLREN